jgi:hypothetical protein
MLAAAAWRCEQHREHRETPRGRRASTGRRATITVAVVVVALCAPAGIDVAELLYPARRVRGTAAGVVRVIPLRA